MTRMKQFTNTTLICGQSVDVNFYEEDTVTREEALAIIREEQKRHKEVWRYIWAAKQWGPPPAEIQ